MKKYIIGSYYKIVQERKPPTAKQLQKLEEWRKQQKEKRDALLIRNG